MMNSVQLQGRVAFVKYNEGQGDKKSFISFAISHNTGKKANPTDQYNKEDLFRCKAWGPTADFINKYFPERSQILVEGTLSVGQDYTDNNGNLQKGGVEILINKTHFCGNKEDGAATNNTQTKAPAPAAPVAPKVAPTPVAPKPIVRPIVPKK